jgi:hypothetical protein
VLFSIFRSFSLQQEWYPHSHCESCLRSEISPKIEFGRPLTPRRGIAFSLALPFVKLFFVWSCALSSKITCDTEFCYPQLQGGTIFHSPMGTFVSAELRCKLVKDVTGAGPCSEGPMISEESCLGQRLWGGKLQQNVATRAMSSYQVGTVGRGLVKSIDSKGSGLFLQQPGGCGEN